ncbi:calmodulin binding protein PICBP-like isoform X1 [Senna tora]|uniref:Calmodulin binding protein PICBP-like isoform X1 n=1 Tax=Senna tora TaxID=362788 RepID=A0A835CEP4_9FABA|nr:calmodulin binding protein PICBP-like isoform X1 [Senna tora]
MHGCMHALPLCVAYMVPSSKLGIQADHVKSKLSSSQNQDGKSRGADMKKKMKKTKTIKLSDMEILRSSSSPNSKKSFSQPGKPPPLLHVPPTSSSSSSSSPQKHTPLIRTSDGSPNYMKPTSSSDAKKELFPVSLRNSKTSSKSAGSSFSGKKPAKSFTKSSSSPSLKKLVRTLTKTPSFKKSSRVALCAADRNAQRATCSSTLKDSKFPPYLMLNPGATESEGTSVMKVCPYTYCSLNGHHHAPLPPLKSFLSARRRIMKTQKSMKLEALSPRRLKVPCEPKKESDIGVDFFIEIYSKKNEDKEETGKNEEDFKSSMEENSLVAQGDDYMKQVIASLFDGSPKSEIDSEDDFGKYFDDVADEADSKGSFSEEQEAEFADEKISFGRSYCNEMEGSNSEATDMEWEHEEEDDADSSVLTEEENDSKIETLSESSHDVSVMWLDDIISIYYEDILEANAEERTCFEGQPLEIICQKEHDLTDEVLQELADAEGNGKNDETAIETIEVSSDFTEESSEKNEEKDETDCIAMVQNETLDGTSSSLADQVSDASKECRELDQIETEEEVAVNHFTPEEDTRDKMEKEDDVSDVSQECEVDKISEEGEDNDTSKNWKGPNRRKRAAQDEEGMRDFNPREPNFLPLVPDPEAEKVDLKHQMMDERKNAEEWMLDYALRQTVTKLAAPARKRKVALLVEAFEAVIPIPKYETHMRNKSSFAHARPIQACS